MRLHFQIDAHSGIPVYRQIMDQIKYYIASESLRVGDQLPSVRELAQQLAVNPTTIVKAYNELDHEEVIQLRHGKGAFVIRTAGPFSTREKEKALRRLVRQLSVESVQMGASLDFVRQMLDEEWAHLGESGMSSGESAGSGG